MNLKASDKQIVDGILLLNKPTGLTSNAVLQRVKRMLHAKKAGHTGSLDPLATGMLPICFGEATKFSQYLLNADKCYEVTGLLGVKTDTADSTGKPIATVSEVHITLEQLTGVLQRFQGTILQTPSMFSALKHQGTPLYRFAREGIEVERPAREISIYQLQLNSFNGKEFKLTVTCSKGTYIRNLVEDIGDELKVGAHVTQLHRTYTAGFINDPMFTLEELAECSLAALRSQLLPIERAVEHLPKLILKDEEVVSLRHGKTIETSVHPTGYVRLYDVHHQFIGLGQWKTESDNRFLHVKRLINFH